MKIKLNQLLIIKSIKNKEGKQQLLIQIRV